MVEEGGAGPPPVRILRPESSVTSESSVQDKLIGAASIFADLLRLIFLFWIHNTI